MVDNVIGNRESSLCLTKQYIYILSIMKVKNTKSIFKSIGANLGTNKEVKTSYDNLEVKDQKEWRKWLNDNHNIVDGIWLTIFKKSSVGSPLKYDEALDHALCYGWIDGQRKSNDA